MINTPSVIIGYSKTSRVSLKINSTTFLLLRCLVSVFQKYFISQKVNVLLFFTLLLPMTIFHLADRSCFQSIIKRISVSLNETVKRGTMLLMRWPNTYSQYFFLYVILKASTSCICIGVGTSGIKRMRSNSDIRTTESK